MRVELSADLLASEHSRMAVLGILALGASGRHVVVADPSPASGAAERFEAWRQKLADPHLQDEIELALAEGLQRATVGPRRSTVIVSATPALGHYPPDEALLLLGYPFRVLLENGRNDRDFLLAYASADTRVYLRDAEEQGWLLFETAGGITEIKARLEEIRKMSWARLRFFCLVDSDAKQPGIPSAVAESVRTVLGEIAADIPLPADQVGKLGKVLERRAVENYLPLPTFKRYIFGRLKKGPANDVDNLWQQAPPTGWQISEAQLGETGSERRALFAALALEGASDEVLTYLDFCQGRGPDGSRTVDVVWNQLSQRQQQALLFGFTKSLLRGFFSDHVEHDPVALSEPTGELAAILAVIQERL